MDALRWYPLAGARVGPVGAEALRVVRAWYVGDGPHLAGGGDAAGEQASSVKTVKRPPPGRRVAKTVGSPAPRGATGVAIDWVTERSSLALQGRGQRPRHARERA
jgi:hypothetical protein